MEPGIYRLQVSLQVYYTRETSSFSTIIPLVRSTSYFRPKAGNIVECLVRYLRRSIVGEKLFSRIDIIQKSIGVI